MDLLDQIENSLGSYNHAFEIENGRSAYAQRRHIENNCPAWLAQLVRECQAYRKFGMTADTAAAIYALHEENPLKLVYVCSPYKGDRKANIEAARGYCLEAMAEGYIPIAPHVMYYGIIDDDDPGQRAIGRKIGLELLRFCRELRVYGSVTSEGMRSEIATAEAIKIPVRRMDAN